MTGRTSFSLPSSSRSSSAFEDTSASPLMYSSHQHDQRYLSWWYSPRRRKFLVLAVITAFLGLLLLARGTGYSLDNFHDRKTVEAVDVADASPLTITQTYTITTAAATVTETFTAHAPTITETVTIYKDGSSNAEPVVFVLIMFSEDSASEGAVLMKSIILYNTSPTEFHIICDEPAQEYLQKRLSLVTHPSHNVRVYFYRLTWEQMRDRVEREGGVVTDHSAGIPGLMKLFVHEILPPTVPKAIFVDTDAMFVADPTLLWLVFSRLKPNTAIVMPSHPDQNSPPWHQASRICSCIMLLDLEKLRALRLMDSSIYRADTSGKYPDALAPPTFRQKYGPPGDDGHYVDVKLGDQGYWWAIVDGRPDIFEPLSYDFEVTSCLLNMYGTGLGRDDITEKQEMEAQSNVKDTPQWGDVVLPKLLHFNCLHGTPRYFEWPGWSDPTDLLNQRWGPAVAYHVGVKWIWLNSGKKSHSDATLEMVIRTDVIFADEQFALDHI